VFEGAKRPGQCRWCWLGLLFMPLALADSLRLGIDETTAGFHQYVDYQPGEPLSGALIDFWRCVLEPEGRALDFSVRPILRNRQALEQGLLDVHLSSLFSDQDEASGSRYTDAFLSANVALVSLASNASLLSDGAWQQQTLGVVLRSNFEHEIQRRGGRISDRVKTIDQLFKLLIGGRVSLISMPLARSAEEVTRYRGVALAGRNLLASSVHGLVSSQLLAADPEFMLRINKRLPACQHLLTPVTQSTLR